MEDEEIIELYWDRDEAAIRETASKYGRLCRFVAGQVLKSEEDREECVSDTYLGVWNAIPTQRPRRLGAFLSAITRNLALKRCEYLTAEKRRADMVLSLEELEECVSGNESVESQVEDRRTAAAIDRFLATLEKKKRIIFLWRHWYFLSIPEICRRTGYSESKVRSMLHHTRKALRRYLNEEGIEV